MQLNNGMVSRSACAVKLGVNPMVTCNTCAYLAVRDNDSNEVRESLEETRKRGIQTGCRGTVNAARVDCYALSPDFPQKAGPGLNDRELPVGELTLRQIGVEIPCGSWEKYQPTRSPKEQKEMSILDKVEAENQRSKIEQRRDIRINRFFTGVGVLVAVIALAVSLLKPAPTPIIQIVPGAQRLAPPATQPEGATDGP